MNESNSLERYFTSIESGFEKEPDYWFIRTDSGSLFDEFRENGIIAIGWDFLTLKELEMLPSDFVKRRIANHHKWDLNTTSGKSNTTTVYNKLYTFINLKIGDVVVVPSKNSDVIGFGRIADRMAYENGNQKTYRKQRRVEWIDFFDIDRLDPIFYRVKSNQHTLSSLNGYSSYIDQVIKSVFIKNDYTHLVLRINKESDLSLRELTKLMTSFETVLNKIDSDFADPRIDEERFIRLRLMSPGTIEIKHKQSKSLAVMGLLLFLSSCGQDSNEFRNAPVEVQRKFVEIRNDLDEMRGILEEVQYDSSQLAKSLQ